MKIRYLFAVFILSLVTVFAHETDALASGYTFPVLGKSTFTNDYYAKRSSGTHHAIDIMANKHQPIVSATDGTITYVAYPQPSWGFMVTIVSDGGYKYEYIHMNNDRKGTDDGKGGAMGAYAPDVKRGNRVVRGQLLGWVGDSGNAESTAPHLHFEVSRPDGKPTNPYKGLVNAKRISKPVNYPALTGEILPYGNAFKGGVNVALGDVDGDGTQETASGAGKGGGPRVKVYSPEGTELNNFYAFNSKLRNGVDVALGDVDGDGVDEIIAGALTTLRAEVAVYKKTADGTISKVSQFVPFDSHKAVITVATGDIDGDGVEEIVVGSGAGYSPQIGIYSRDGTLINKFAPYAESFKGGVNVAAGNVVSEEGEVIRDEIVAAPGTTGSSRVLVFNQDLQQIREFYAYSKSFRGGAKIDVGDVIPESGLDEIVTMPHQNAAPAMNYYNAEGKRLRSQMMWEEWWLGYYDVAAGDSDAKAAAGINRRASIR